MLMSFLISFMTRKSGVEKKLRLREWRHINTTWMSKLKNVCHACCPPISLSLSFSHTCARKHSHSHTRTYLRAMEHALTHSSTNSAKVRRLKRELNLYFEKEWYTRSPLLLLSRSLSLSLSLWQAIKLTLSLSPPLSFSCYVFVVWVWLPADNLITSCCSSVLVRLRLETSSLSLSLSSPSALPSLYPL